LKITTIFDIENINFILKWEFKQNIFRRPILKKFWKGKSCPRDHVGNFVTCLLKNIFYFWRGKSSPSDQKGYFVTWLLKNILLLERRKAYDTELCDLTSEKYILLL
jgi:hypothetical protein